MSAKSEDKDESIGRLIDEVHNAFGSALVQVDNWDADRFAVGFTNEARADRLVYINSFNQPAGSFWYVSEISGDPVAEGVATLSVLLAALREHLLH